MLKNISTKITYRCIGRNAGSRPRMEFKAIMLLNLVIHGMTNDNVHI